MHALDIDGAAKRHCTVASPIDIGGEDMDFVASGRQFTAESVHRPDRPPITYCGQICGDDMKKAQKLVPRLKFVQLQ